VFKNDVEQQVSFRVTNFTLQELTTILQGETSHLTESYDSSLEIKFAIKLNHHTASKESA
jgi:hypothetical protein